MHLNWPNALTLGRILAVPVMVALLAVENNAAARAATFVLFMAAALTDWLDGYLARRLDQRSALGAMMDPIADKLLVAAVLAMLIADKTLSGLDVISAVLILCREVLVSGLREALAPKGVSLPVSRLAKWKTAIQLGAIGILLAAPLEILFSGGDVSPDTTSFAIGRVMLFAAALLSVWTAVDYVKAAVKHLDVHEDAAPDCNES